MTKKALKDRPATTLRAGGDENVTEKEIQSFVPKENFLRFGATCSTGEKTIPQIKNQTFLQDRISRAFGRENAL